MWVTNSPAGRFCVTLHVTLAEVTKITFDLSMVIESGPLVFTNRQISLSTFDLHPLLWSDSVTRSTFWVIESGYQLSRPVTLRDAVSRYFPLYFLRVFLCIFALEIQAKGRQISIMKKKTICYKIYIEKSELSEIGKVCTSEAENLNLTHCGYAN